MHILKKKTDNKVTTDISQEGGEYRVRLFVNGNPQCEVDYFTDDWEDATQKAKAMREDCMATGAKDATKSTKELIKESEQVGIRDEEDARRISDKIYKPILHRFGIWLFEAEEYRVYSGHTKLTKDLEEELWGIRYDLELFDESGLYDPPVEVDPWHESPSCLWDTLEEKTTAEDFGGYDRYKAKRDAE